MKICIASHIVLDTIQDINGLTVESLGGPCCYGSILANTFKFNVKLATKVGCDFSKKELEILENEKIILDPSQIDPDSSTTRFKLILTKDGGRKLFLLSKCSPLSLSDFDNVDGIILSPVFDEIPEQNLYKLVNDREKNQFIMLDPQGYLRFKNKEGNLILYRNQLDLNLKGITGLKADEDELSSLTNGDLSNLAIQRLKEKFNLDFVISTARNNIELYHKNILYIISLKKINSPDHTGLGDILTTGFSCAYLKEKDPLWAICFAAGSVVAALETKKRGLEKVPKNFKAIERNATYFYNLIKFKILE